MSLVGLGRAFNLRYRPNGPLRFNCYQRQMPTVFGGGNYSYTENINIQQGPSGFWGFMSGLTQGYFGMSALLGGGLFGGGGGLFGILNSKQQGATDPTAAGEDNHLKNLTDFYGKNFIIKSHPDKKGIYQAVPKEGGKPIEGTYDELMEKLASQEPEKTKENKEAGGKSDAELKAEEEAKAKAEAEAKAKAAEEEALAAAKAAKAKGADGAGGSRRANRAKDAKGADGATGTKKADKGKEVSDHENKTHQYTASVQWKTVPIMNSFGIKKGYQCTAIVSFTDLKGEQHVYNRTEKYESYTTTDREAKCKAMVIEGIQASMKKDGWTNVTIK